ncbi:MAG TPA: hypothetical protein VJ742_05630 [Nitrososphaera sp.]|nr:hypothetical protein [Nitrososphaera sp.]
MEIEMEPDEYSLQEQQELEQWLSEYDKETIKNLDFHIQRMWESYQTFKANQPKEASNGTDSQKT